MTTPRTRKANAPVMDNAPKPQDHKEPARHEADGDDVLTIEFHGTDFEIPVPDDWTLDAVEAFSKGDPFTGLREILGTDQWATFKANFNRRKYLEEFSNLVGQELGFGTTGN